MGAAIPCLACGQDLTGLAPSGTCPECGARYDIDLEARSEPWPRADLVFMRYAWPLALPLLPILPIAFLRGSDMREAATMSACVGVPVFLVAALVNSILVSRALARRHVPSRSRTSHAVLTQSRRSFGILASLLAFVALAVAGVALSWIMLIFVHRGR